MADAARARHLFGEHVKACSSQGEEGREKPSSLWKGGSPRRLPGWEKGLWSLLSGRGISEEGISLNWECKGSLQRLSMGLEGLSSLMNNMISS